MAAIPVHATACPRERMRPQSPTSVFPPRLNHCNRFRNVDVRCTVAPLLSANEQSPWRYKGLDLRLRNERTPPWCASFRGFFRAPSPANLTFDNRKCKTNLSTTHGINLQKKLLLSCAQGLYFTLKWCFFLLFRECFLHCSKVYRMTLLEHGFASKDGDGGLLLDRRGVSLSKSNC